MSMQILNAGGQPAAINQSKAIADFFDTVIKSEKPVSEEPQKVRLTDAEVERMVQEIQRATTIAGNKLNFTIDKQLDELVVKVIDPDTDKVIKEIPPVALQKLQIRMKETFGLLFDELA